MPMTRVAAVFAALVGAAVLTTACGDQGTSTTAASTTNVAGQTSGAATSAGTPSAAPAAVPEQLRFTAKTVDGASFDGASLAGKPSVLWFWAPWCPKCNAEAPSLREVAQANAGKVTFVGVAAQDQVPAMQDFVRKHSLGSFVHLADTDAVVWRRFGVTYQPAYAFVSASGEVKVEKQQLTKDELAGRVAALTGS